MVDSSFWWLALCNMVMQQISVSVYIPEVLYVFLTACVLIIIQIIAFYMQVVSIFLYQSISLLAHFFRTVVEMSLALPFSNFLMMSKISSSSHG